VKTHQIETAHFSSGREAGLTILELSSLRRLTLSVKAGL
jgi:hypothetical protein